MARALKFRNAHGETVDLPEVPATRFKNEFGAIFEKAGLGGAGAITKPVRWHTPPAHRCDPCAGQQTTCAGRRTVRLAGVFRMPLVPGIFPE
jgi:hypothetical protein